MKFNVERKKASVEAMLKTAMQSQLDGVRTGLTQLERAMADIAEVRRGMEEMEESLTELPDLLEDLSEVRRETMKHSQLAAARENLKHIFTVPEAVGQTEALITEGRLLEAHKALVELENSRDDLLFELHRLPGRSPRADREMLVRRDFLSFCLHSCNRHFYLSSGGLLRARFAPERHAGEADPVRPPPHPQHGAEGPQGHRHRPQNHREGGEGRRRVGGQAEEYRSDQ